jgi:hypothetical protein
VIAEADVLRGADSAQRMEAVEALQGLADLIRRNEALVERGGDDLTDVTWCTRTDWSPTLVGASSCSRWTTARSAREPPGCRGRRQRRDRRQSSRQADRGPVTGRRSDRHSYYRLPGPAMGQLIEALQQLAPAVPVPSPRQGTRAQALRQLVLSWLRNHRGPAACRWTSSPADPNWSASWSYPRGRDCARYEHEGDSHRRRRPGPLGMGRAHAAGQLCSSRIGPRIRSAIEANGSSSYLEHGERPVRCRSSDRLLLYTDGITGVVSFHR